MVMGPAVVGVALGEAAGAEAARVAGLVVMSNELYCERAGLQGLSFGRLGMHLARASNCSLYTPQGRPKYGW
jgi:hypothetical protein